MKRIFYTITLALQLLLHPIKVSCSDIKLNQLEGAQNLIQVEISYNGGDNGNDGGGNQITPVLVQPNDGNYTCVERGTYPWDGDFSSSQYQALTASQKMERLWNKIIEVPFVICAQFSEIADMFQDQSPRVPFNHVGDEMPRLGQGKRNKLVHQQGITAQAEFIAAEDTPYTGIFKGAENVIIRMSETGFLVDDISRAANPSIGLKFLRNGVPSANQLGMISFEGTNSWNFFENDLMNMLPDFQFDCGPKTLAKYNSQATKFIFQNGNYDLATYDQNGTQVPTDQINYPFFLRFKPGPSLPETDGESRFFDQLDGDAIPAGTDIFEVWALDKPNGTSDPASTPEDERYIGVIRSKTPFTQSLWGDERLFFQHTRLNRDIRYRSDFRQRQTVRFDNDRWGHWPEDGSANVPDISDSDFIDQLSVGCPFQWIIDSLNF